jgi:hypothetical protein
MLLAEIHGKRCIEAESNEDWLTSAVFGHLRSVPPAIFWAPLFSMAETEGAIKTDLRSELLRQSVRLEDYQGLEILFWKDCGRYGEPDLLLRFTAPSLRPVVVLIEVKLYSSKSGTGENDQLARYLRFLDDPNGLEGWTGATAVTALLYLTEQYAAAEIQDSIAASQTSTAASKIFGLQWQALLRAAEISEGASSILREVAIFLKGRGFEAFSGFHPVPLPSKPYEGLFYNSIYFKESQLPTWAPEQRMGQFYD